MQTRIDLQNSLATLVTAAQSLDSGVTALIAKYNVPADFTAEVATVGQASAAIADAAQKIAVQLGS